MAGVQMLDPFIKQVVAPLGILFPFPFYCRLLDTYMKSHGDIAAIKAKTPQMTGEVVGFGAREKGRIMVALHASSHYLCKAYGKNLMLCKLSLS